MLRFLEVVLAASLITTACSVGGEASRDALLEGAHFQIQTENTVTPVDSFEQLVEASSLKAVLPSEAPAGTRLVRVWVMRPSERRDTGTITLAHQWWLMFEDLGEDGSQGFSVQQYGLRIDIGDSGTPVDIDGVEGLFNTPNELARMLVWYDCGRTFMLGYQPGYFSDNEALDVARSYIEVCE